MVGREGKDARRLLGEAGESGKKLSIKAGEIARITLRGDWRGNEEITIGD